MDPTLLPLPLQLLASAPQDAEPPATPRVTAVAVARARIISAARVSLSREQPVRADDRPRRERRIVRADGRVEIQFE
ncbi:hypothetical protein [Sphingomonas gilva]|nr:hypothetical protein [Sphingomonas gilva]